MPLTIADRSVGLYAFGVIAAALYARTQTGKGQCVRVAMQEAVKQVKVDESLLDYALEIVERTRTSEQLSLGVSPRGAVMLHRAAQARAFLEGRDFCLPDDFKRLILPVFSHRVVVSSRYVSTQRKSAQAEAILDEILETTRVPL